MSDSGENLLQRCRRDDQKAWELLVGRYSGLVLALATREGLPSDRCEDVLQTVFMMLFRDIDRIRNERAIPTWLTVATRRVSRRVARAMRRGNPGECHEVMVADIERDNLEKAELVRWGLTRLCPRCQELIERLFLQQPPESYESLARRLDMPIGSIGPNRRRCLEQLATLLPSDLFET